MSRKDNHRTQESTPKITLFFEEIKVGTGQLQMIVQSRDKEDRELNAIIHSIPEFIHKMLRSTIGVSRIWPRS